MSDSDDTVQIKSFFKSGVYKKNFQRTSLRCQLRKEHLIDYSVTFGI